MPAQLQAFSFWALSTSEKTAHLHFCLGKGRLEDRKRCIDASTHQRLEAGAIVQRRIESYSGGGVRERGS
jgi:hypothetical protein